MEPVPWTVIYSRQVELAVAELQYPRLLPQEFYIELVRLGLGVLFELRIKLMISEAPPDSGGRAKAPQFDQATIERIGPGGNQIARDERQIRPQIIARV